jgi:hypothetical protein
MLEPATASIAVYLLAKTPLNLNKNKQLLLRRPYYIKRKVCKWILNNQNELTERIIDEGSDYLIDFVNIIKINPTIFVFIYIIALILIIII